LVLEGKTRSKPMF
jgi:hypothetical protein